MKREKLEELILQAADLSYDHEYLGFKVPKILEQLKGVKRVPKDLRDEYDAALEDMEYINNTW